MLLQRLCLILILMIITTACSGRTTPEPVATTQVAVATSTSVISTNTPSPDIDLSPTLTPLPTQERVECPDAPATRLIIQDRGRVTDDNDDTLNLRAGAGTDFEILARLEPLDMFLVLEGPVCADGFAWYRVRAGTRIGWIAEGDTELYYTEPYLTG